MNGIDIAIWTHRWSDWLPKCAQSVAQHTRQSYNLIVVCEPGNCHENMNRVLARSHGRYLVFLDEDVEILDDDWLSLLVSDLVAYSDLGVVGCREAKDEFQRAFYRQDRAKALSEFPTGLSFTTWIPAFVMVFDRQRYPTLHFDENIPGDKGMTDVDACLQLRQHGLRVAVDNRLAVYHPSRLEADRGRNGVPKKEDELAWFEKQRDYMAAKWGETYTGDKTLQLVKVIDP